jgi:hypothetical protein
LVLHISSSWIKLSLHTEFQLPKFPRSGLKFSDVGGWWWLLKPILVLSVDQAEHLVFCFGPNFFLKTQVLDLDQAQQTNCDRSVFW